MLEAVDFEIKAGTVHGLVGQNGCGKSTLVKLMTGALRPQRGCVYIDDEEVSFAAPAGAQALGVGVVHQDYNLFPDLSVAENVVGVGGSLPRRWAGLVDRRAIESEVERMLRLLDIELAPDALVRSLDAAEMKFVEIVRAMRLAPRFLILDEPTASLEPQGSERVLALLKRLRDQGVGVCFISHRLSEVLDVCDEITVLRDGALATRVSVGDITVDELVHWIVGAPQESRGPSNGHRASEAKPGQGAAPAAKPVLGVRELKLRRGQRPVRFDLRRGEILGLTGLVGSGASTVVRMTGGVETMRGHLEVEGRQKRVRNPRDAERLGIGFIPEDRKSAGSIPELSVAVNISLASLDRVGRAGVINYWRMRARAQQFADKLDIRAASIDSAAKTLSGGNLQKVLLAKWLASDARVLAIEEPTHGIDIGAKAQVHGLLREFTRRGGSILVSLSEVEEALQLCDRVAVFRDGGLVVIEDAHALSEAELTLLATGADSQQAET